jgi:hypothetical protein
MKYTRPSPELDSAIVPPTWFYAGIIGVLALFVAAVS